MGVRVPKHHTTCGQDPLPACLPPKDIQELQSTLGGDTAVSVVTGLLNTCHIYLKTKSKASGCVHTRKQPGTLGRRGLPALALSTERTPLPKAQPSCKAQVQPGEPQISIFTDKAAEPRDESKVTEG